MLYDQALIAMAYLEAYQATGKEEYSRTAQEILNYVLKYLTSPDGAFYSAESADSEGEEGRFYLWTSEEINKVLKNDESRIAAEIFNIKDEGNFTDPIILARTGRNVLYTDPVTNKHKQLETIREKLLNEREKRPRPERDDKVLTDWNGLMIAALAKAARILEKPHYGEAARKAALFILKNVRTKEGRLRHRWRNGQAGLDPTAADYSFFTWGLLELYGWDFDSVWLAQALELTDKLNKGYWDQKLGGFYLTTQKENSVLPRIKENIDIALPSSNSVAMYNLLRLSRLTGNTAFEKKASEISRVMSARVKDSEPAFPMLLAALALGTAPSQEVVIVGKEGASDTKDMFANLRQSYFPNAVTVFKPAEEKSPPISKYVNYIEFMYAINNRATAYVCTDFKCNFPTNDPSKMLDNLRTISVKADKTEPPAK
jgi:uncharacterized protein YyaL (SSP411 family)